MVPRLVESSRNARKCREVCAVVQRVGNRVTEFRFKYFCLDYVSKIGVSVTERNILPTCLSHTLTDAPPCPTWRAEGIHVGTHRYGWEHVSMGGHVSVGPRASVWHVRAVGATGEGLGACIWGLGVAECGRSGAGLRGVAWRWHRAGR